MSRHSIADESSLTIGIHTASVHSMPGFDGFNPGIYARWPNGVTIGAFRNSYSRNSVYAGWLWSIGEGQRWGVFWGAATGYGATSEKAPVAPIIAPTARFELAHTISARISLFPDPRKGAAQVLHLSFEFGI